MMNKKKKGRRREEEEEKEIGRGRRKEKIRGQE